MAMKVCARCGQPKLLTEFHAHKGFKDGRRPICKECRKAQEAKKPRT